MPRNVAAAAGQQCSQPGFGASEPAGSMPAATLMCFEGRADGRWNRRLYKSLLCSWILQMRTESSVVGCNVLSVVAAESPGRDPGSAVVL